MPDRVQRGSVDRRIQIGIPTDQIDKDCRVYLFYFEGFTPHHELMAALKNLGERSGQNLDVVKLNEDDRQYPIWIKKFIITKVPAVVITGSDSVASFGKGDDQRTAYIKLDQESMLTDVPATMDYVQEMYNLFLQGDVKQALNAAKPALGQIKFSHFLQKSGKITAKLIDYVETHKIDVNIGPIKIDFERSESNNNMDRLS